MRFDPLDASDPAQAAIDEAYHAKYDRYGPRYVSTVVGPSARQTTLKIEPAR